MRKRDKGKKVFGVFVILAIIVSVFCGVVSAVDVSGGLKQSVYDAEIQTAVGNLSSEELAKSNSLTFTIFATHIGCVGGTTANGHVVQPRDHFVALPSRKVLCSDDKAPHEYEVRVTYLETGKSVVAPVWDIGPWNTKDNYWDPPSEREMWQDLPQGTPEAQAADQDGYNGGFDETNYLVKAFTGSDAFSVGDRVRPTVNGLSVRSSPGGSKIGSVSTSDIGTVIDGPVKAVYNSLYYKWWKIDWDDITWDPGWSAQKRYVSNSAGIDLADGTFWDDLGMTDNGWVTVEFLWTTGDKPDLTPYKPSGWSDKIVVSKRTGTNTDDTDLTEGDTLYVDWAVINQRTGDIIDTKFYYCLYVDGSLKATWSSTTLHAGYYVSVEDYSIGKLNAGTHTIKIVADPTDAIHESNEDNNEYSKTIKTEKETYPPQVTTNAATGIDTTSATLNGNLDSTGGETCQVWFQYGKTTSYSDFLPSKPKSSTGPFRDVLSDLDEDTIYHFRAVASNSVGTAFGDDKTFKTDKEIDPPLVTTNAATNEEETTATLNGVINNDGGEACQYRFEYDTNPGEPYAYNTGWTGSKTTGQSFSASIPSLAKGTKYYSRAQAKNSAGTASGTELTFLTKPDAPTIFSATTAGTTQIDLSWTKGAGAQKTRIQRKQGSYPANRNDGTQVYFGTGSSTPDTGLTPGTTYYYRAWSYVQGSEQWSDNYAQASATTTLIPPLLCTSPDPPSHNFGNVPEGETRSWTFDITNCGGGTLTWTVSDDRTWITVNPTSGSTTTETDTVTVTIDTTGLACGTTHTGTITVSSNDGTKTGTISVYVPCAPPLLCTSPDPPSHNFGNVPEGETRSWTFDITNCGGGTLTWTVSDDRTWITVNPTSGSTTTETDTVTVTIDTTGLACGTTHTGTITVSSNDGTKTGTISVYVPCPAPLLCTSPDPPSHNFGNVPEGETRSWTFDITNCGGGTLTWTVSDDRTWITVNPTSGSTTTETDTVTVTIDTTGLACGTTHTGTITVSSNDGTKTGTISVYVPCAPPLLCTSPDPPSHNFGNVPEGETRSWTFDITNCGGGTLTWTVSDDRTWITVNPTSGSTTTETDTVTVTIDTTGLACGTTHTGTITVSSNDGTKTGTISVYVPCPAPLLCTSPDPPSHNFGNVPEGETRSWTFDITNCGGGTLTWTVSDDRTWITVNPTSGSTTTETDTVTVTIDTTGLACGTTHTGTITVSSNDGTKTGTISVYVPCPAPLLCTSPDPPSHNFGNVPEGETRSWSFDITNCGGGTLTWTVSDDRTWITVNPTSGSTTTETDHVTVTIDTTGLQCTNTGTITVSSNDGTKIGTIGVYVTPCIIENEVYLVPQHSTASFCNPTIVQIWINGTDIAGAYITFTYDPACVNTTDVQSANFPRDWDWNSAINGKEIIAGTTSDGLNRTGNYLFATLTIHCLSNDCTTNLNFLEGSDLFDQYGASRPATWIEGTFECRSVCGDVNHADDVNYGDVILLRNHLIHGFPISDPWAADVNCQNAINYGDVILLRNHIVQGFPLNCC